MENNMEKYLEIFGHLLDNDGQKALNIVYDEELKEFHENAHAYLRYNLTDININLNCFCGVNIETENDLDLLKTMINKWNEQYLKIPLYISIYYSEKFKKEVNIIDLKKVNIIELKEDKLFCYYSEIPLSQFDHYKNILNNFENIDDNMWCIFTNHYDMWKKHRSCVFNILINLYNTCKFEKVPLYIKYHYVCDKNNNVDIVQYGTKTNDLKRFIYNSNDLVIKHHYCKLYYIKYLTLNDGVCLALPDHFLFKELYTNLRKDNYNENDFKDTMILYFSKRKSFNVGDFEKFWKCYIPHLDFNLVKKNSIMLYNQNSDLKIFQNSLLIF
jgi:hypothetical protein